MCVLDLKEEEEEEVEVMKEEEEKEEEEQSLNVISNLCINLSQCISKTVVTG